MPSTEPSGFLPPVMQAGTVEISCQWVLSHEVVESTLTLTKKAVWSTDHQPQFHNTRQPPQAAGFHTAIEGDRLLQCGCDAGKWRNTAAFQPRKCTLQSTRWSRNTEVHEMLVLSIAYAEVGQACSCGMPLL